MPTSIGLGSTLAGLAPSTDSKIEGADMNPNLRLRLSALSRNMQSTQAMHSSQRSRAPASERVARTAASHQHLALSHREVRPCDPLAAAEMLR